MSLNKLFVIFGIILVIFAGIIFFQFYSQPKADRPLAKKTSNSTVTINNHTFNLEIAKTPKEQIAGLSGRSSLPQDQGMLFIFDTLDYHNFWMKNMKFPIDILFIKDDIIVNIIESAKPALSTNTNPPILKPDRPINKVLEINAGLSRKYSIKKGDSIKIKLQ